MQVNDISIVKDHILHRLSSTQLIMTKRDFASWNFTHDLYFEPIFKYAPKIRPLKS